MLRIERAFPGLTDSTFSIESPSTFDYNCIAWAAGSDNRVWWPDIQNQYYWPDGIRREDTLAAFTELFESFGFEICDDPELEVGFEKVAVYAGADGKPKHAARQLPSGKWTSKLGPWEDIEHGDFDSLEGVEYGSVSVIMRRPRPSDGQKPNPIARIFRYLISTPKARI